MYDKQLLKIFEQTSVNKRKSKQNIATHLVLFLVLVVHTCTVPRTQSRLGDRSFGVAGPRLWNNLPVELRQQDICLTEFRRLLKTVLFAETRRIVTSLF